MVSSGVSPERTSTSSAPASAACALRTASPVPSGCSCTATVRPSNSSAVSGEATTTSGSAPSGRAASTIQSTIRRPRIGCRCLGVAESIACPPASGHDDGCELGAGFGHGRHVGWGARIRTWDHGTKTRCLTTWPRPSESGRRVYPDARSGADATEEPAATDDARLRHHDRLRRRSTGEVTQVRPQDARPGPPRRLAAIGEEAVDARAGAADVGPETLRRAKLLRERRRRRSLGGNRARSSGASHGGERLEQLAPGARRSLPARPAHRRLRRRRRSTSSRRSPGSTSTTEKSCGRLERLEDGAVTGCRVAARSRRKNGTSAPIVAASAVEPIAVERHRQQLVRETKQRGAASELPPPSPAAMGIDFVISTRPGGLTPAAAASACECLRVTIVSSVEAGDGSDARPPRRATRSARATRCITVATSCLPSARERADDEREVDLRRALEARSCDQPRQLDEHGRRERLGPHRRIEPELGRGPRPPPRESRRRRAGASWRASCGGARTRPRRRDGCRRSCSGSGSRRNATSAESTLGGGLKTVRETGWKPVRRLRAGRARKPHRTPSSTGRRRSDRQPRAAPSRTRARESGGLRGSPRRSGSRCCRAGSRPAWSERGSRCARSSRKASPQCSDTFGRGARPRR